MLKLLHKGMDQMKNQLDEQMNLRFRSLWNTMALSFGEHREDIAAIKRTRLAKKKILRRLLKNKESLEPLKEEQR